MIDLDSVAESNEAKIIGQMMAVLADLEVNTAIIDLQIMNVLQGRKFVGLVSQHFVANILTKQFYPDFSRSEYPSFEIIVSLEPV